MFEAVYNIVALVESNGHAERIFKVFEQGEPLHESEFISLVANMYQQEVYRTLRAGDTLSIAMHLDTPSRVIRRTVQFREDKQFEGDGLQQPTSDLTSTISAIYEEFSQQVVAGDVFGITFRLHRP